MYSQKCVFLQDIKCIPLQRRRCYLYAKLTYVRSYSHLPPFLPVSSHFLSPPSSPSRLLSVIIQHPPFPPRLGQETRSHLSGSDRHLETGPERPQPPPTAPSVSRLPCCRGDKPGTCHGDRVVFTQQGNQCGGGGEVQQYSLVVLISLDAAVQPKVTAFSCVCTSKTLKLCFMWGGGGGDRGHKQGWLIAVSNSFPGHSSVCIKGRLVADRCE